MNLLDRVEAAFDARVRRARSRSAKFDHFWRARSRYEEVYGGRLAAAIAYYGFFAAFALALLAFSVLGAVLRNNQAVVTAVQEYLRSNLPQLNVATLSENSATVRPFALVALLFAGVGWVEALRSSQRAIWNLEQQPGNPVVRWLVDLAVLLGLGVLLIVSVSISSGVERLLGKLGGETDGPVQTVLSSSGPVLAVVVDLVLAAALLAVVPRLRMPLRRLLPSAAIIAVGLFLLKTVLRWYVARTQHNPAYAVVSSAVGLLLFMYLLAQFILAAAAVAATSRRGTVVDLAGGGAPKPAQTAVGPVVNASERPRRRLRRRARPEAPEPEHEHHLGSSARPAPRHER